jgi:glutamyl-tRNA synthetase
MSYRDEGFLPEALLNYLVRLGWSHGDQEVFSLEEMIQLFDAEDVNKAASSFNTDKLLWLNQHYIKTSTPEHIAHHIAWHLGELGIDPSQGPNITDVVSQYQERSKTLKEMAQSLQFFYQEVTEYDEKAARKNLTEESLPILEEMLQRLGEVTEWQAEPLHDQVKACAEANEIGMGKVAQPIRVAMTGNTVSPSLDITLELLGRERTLSAIRRAIAFIKDRA